MQNNDTITKEFTDILLHKVLSPSMITSIIVEVVQTSDWEETSRILIPEVQNCETDEEYLETVKRVISERKL